MLNFIFAITLRVKENSNSFTLLFFNYAFIKFQCNGWGNKDMFIFGNKQVNKSPSKNQAFVWVAEYYDGTHLAEYDFVTGQSNSFYAIDKSKLIKFGLIGENSQAYFDVGNGIFTLNKHRLTISYEANGVEYPLTGRTLVYNDIISYKDAVSDASPFTRGKGAFTEAIMQFNFGYKKKMELEDVNINFQCVLGIPMNESAFLQIKITSDTDLDGKILFRRNGEVVDSVVAPLKAGMSGNLDWTIK